MSLNTPMRKPLQPGQLSPVIAKAIRYRKATIASRFQFVWGALDVVVFFLLFAEIKTQYLQSQLVGDNDILRFFLIGVCVSFLASSLINFIQATQATISGRSLALSPKQKQLMGIKHADAPTERKVSSTPVTSYSQAWPAFKLTSLTSSTPTQHRASPLSNSPRFSPFSASQQTSPSPNKSPRLSQTTGTPGYHAGQNSSFLPQQRRLSPPSRGSPIPATCAALDGSSYMDSSSGSPFLRHRMSPFRNSPLSPEEFMTDQKSLNVYLRSHFEKEQQKAQIISLDSSIGSTPGKWAYSRVTGLLDASQELHKNVYQTATPSPKSPTSRKDDKDDASKYAALDYWRKHGISSEILTEWTARVRRWLAITLLAQLVKEISKINSQLKKLGCPEVQVGESSISTLKQIITSRGNQIPNLTHLLPYLEVSNNQEYLVARLKQLASGYMSEFKWNSGGEVKKRKWADDLPTDCEIIMNVFCVYMDSHLPADPRYPDGKTFTSKYFVRTPDKPKLLADGRMVIYQDKVNPPHFKIVTSEDDYNIPQGRNNMFHMFLLFLHNIKEKNDGMLGLVNLGASGINILWILEDD